MYYGEGDYWLTETRGALLGFDLYYNVSMFLLDIECFSEELLW